MSVKHLPPVVKQLLAGRKPNSLPLPPLANLQRVFSQTIADARAQPVNVEKGWLVVSTCALLTANCPPAVGHLYRFATHESAKRVDISEAITKASIMREAALKSTIFVGVPRSILSLTAMHEAWEDDVKEGLRKSSLRQPTRDNVQSIMARGRGLWDSIYEPHAQKLHDKLNSLHPDFMSFVINSYGSVLAPLAEGDAVQGNLGRALSSVVGASCLRAEGGVGPQLISHTFGLLKARDAPGLTEEEQWLASDDGAEWVVRTTDAVVDAVRAGAGEKSRL